MSEVNIKGNRIVTLDGADAVNVGLGCCKCHNPARTVIYHISKPVGTFQAGSYCYACLLKTCRENGRVPFPIEVNLLDQLQFDLTEGGKKKIIISRGGK